MVNTTRECMHYEQQSPHVRITNLYILGIFVTLFVEVSSTQYTV